MLILKVQKSFWDNVDWATITNIAGTIIQTLILAAAIYAILQTSKSLRQSRKALENNEKALETSIEALEISRKDNETLKKQLFGTFKPEFKFEFEDFTYLNNMTDDYQFPQFTYDDVNLMNDYKMTITNVSQYAAKEIEIENFFYLEKEEIRKFESVMPTDLFYTRNIIALNYLGQNESEDVHFTRYTKYYERYATAGEVSGGAKLFLRIDYKNVLDEDCAVFYMFKGYTSTQGRFAPQLDEHTQRWKYEKISEDYYQTNLEDLTINLEEISNERNQ